jgi:hypothetical protein
MSDNSDRSDEEEADQIYLSLPADALPVRLRGAEGHVIRASISFQTTTGETHHVVYRTRPDVRLYAINRSLLDLLDEMNDLSDEMVVLRGYVVAMAEHLNFHDDVPNDENGKTWEALVKKVYVELDRFFRELGARILADWRATMPKRTVH